MRILIRPTRYDRCSIPAVLAVLEAELEPEGIPWAFASNLDDVQPGDLLMYSFSSGLAEHVRAELGGLRSRLGDSLLAIAGGPHPSAVPGEVLAMGFRWVCVGEAGPSVALLVRELLRGSVPPAGVLHDPPAILDKYPAWPTRGGIFSPVEISRGCPHSCAYCQTPSLFGRRMRHRSVPTLERLLRRGVESGHGYTRFVSPNAFAYGSGDGQHADPAALRALLEAARRTGMRGVFLGTFPSEVRPESVCPELLCIVRDLCDNRSLAMGIQSGSEAMLRRIRRGHTVEQGIAAVQCMVRHGFEPRLDFIFGLPGETDADRAATRELVDRLAQEYGARVHLHRFLPLPGTPLAGQAASPLDAVTEAWIAELVGQGRVTGVKRRPPFTRVVHSREQDELRLASATARS